MHRVLAFALVLTPIAVWMARATTAEPRVASPLYRTLETRHFGPKRYRKHWNFWVRIDGDVKTNTDRIWPNFDKPSKALDALLRDMQAPRGKADTEEEFWDRIGLIWNWWKQHVTVDNDAYTTVRSAPDGWPSPDDIGRYYAENGKLVCAACFSKAHLFATLLGRIFYPRERITLAYGHHTQNGAPKTASHVYVAVYVAQRWYYIDPTYAPNLPFPSFEDRKSLGPPMATSIDYTHPFQVTPLPGSTLTGVPYLGGE